MGELVTVACKHPHGLVLHGYDEYTEQVPVLGGGTREEKRYRRNGKTVRLNGNASPKGQSKPYPIVGGYALTHNVDGEFLKNWMEVYKDNDLVKNKIVFCHEKPEVVDKKARDHEKLRSGLEPIDPQGDPRSPKNIATGQLAA